MAAPDNPHNDAGPPREEAPATAAVVATDAASHAEIVDSGDREIDDLAWDPNDPDSAEVRAALTKNLSLELAKSHGKGRIRALTAFLVGSFLALMALLAYRLLTQQRAAQEIEVKAPPPPPGAIYKPPHTSKPKLRPSSAPP